MEKKFNKSEYDREFHGKKYRRFGIFIPREDEAEFLEAVEKGGLSINKYAVTAIMEKMNRER